MNVGSQNLSHYFELKYGMKMNIIIGWNEFTLF